MQTNKLDILMQRRSRLDSASQDSRLMSLRKARGLMWSCSYDSQLCAVDQDFIVPLNKCCVIEVMKQLGFCPQMGTNKCASQAGMTAYGTRRHLYDPKTQTDKPHDQTTISLQMGTNKGASQVQTQLHSVLFHISLNKTSSVFIHLFYMVKNT